LLTIYTVSQVTSYLRDALETDPLLSDLLVIGEVSNLRVSAAGHSYFTLKDSQALLNCVMFKGQPGAQLLANGASVSTHGHMSFYEPRGSTDYVVDLAMSDGVGALGLELERLKLRLESEGLFEDSRKRLLPQFPQVIGVVTSPSGAVFHDIQNVIRRRYPLVELMLSPAQVQGDQAAPQIIAAIEALNREGRSDVIIVARGGGSLEELWPFNEEMVARAIYASRIPVVSAVGHETDVTIADLVADLRAPTPSAAAELVVPDGAILRHELADLAQRSQRAMAYQIEQRRGDVISLARRLESGLPDLETWRRRIDDLGRAVHHSLTSSLKISRMEVTSLEHRLRALDPVATLRRGFSVVQRTGDNYVVTSTSQVGNGDALTITVADGSIPATAGVVSARPPATSKKRKTSGQPQGMEQLL
jgi:exodeoxyribonuclease VII large subunit